MPKKCITRSYQGQRIFVGIDVHLKSWTVTVRILGMEVEHFTMPPSASVLAKHLRSRYPDGDYFSVYEAGFCGFAAHRRLVDQGVKNIVTNPGDVPTRNKERDKKRDSVDSRKLARELQKGSLEAIWVPSPKQEDLRSLCRLRKKLVDHSTRLKNRIKQHLYYRGVVIPAHSELAHWSGRFLTWLEQFCPEGRNPGADSLRITLEELRLQRARITHATRLLRRYTRGNETLALLRTVPGLGFVTAITVYAELMSMKRFRNLNDLCCYIGLVPGSSDSGDKQRNRELSSLGNRHLRYVLIEAAWVAVRKDPDLLDAFSRSTRRMPKNRAIIKIARKLLNRIRHVWNNQTPYQSPAALPASAA